MAGDSKKDGQSFEPGPEDTDGASYRAFAKPSEAPSPSTGASENDPITDETPHPPPPTTGTSTGGVALKIISDGWRRRRLHGSAVPCSKQLRRRLSFSVTGGGSGEGRGGQLTQLAAAATLGDEE